MVPTRRETIQCMSPIVVPFRWFAAEKRSPSRLVRIRFLAFYPFGGKKQGEVREIFSSCPEDGLTGSFSSSRGHPDAGSGNPASSVPAILLILSESVFRRIPGSFSKRGESWTFFIVPVTGNTGRTIDSCQFMDYISTAYYFLFIKIIFLNSIGSIRTGRPNSSGTFAQGLPALERRLV